MHSPSSTQVVAKVKTLGLIGRTLSEDGSGSCMCYHRADAGQAQERITGWNLFAYIDVCIGEIIRSSRWTRRIIQYDGTDESCKYRW
jgi:hypothetical protein